MVANPQNSEDSEEEPESVVFIDGEAGHELLKEGEVSATLFQPDEDGEMRSHDAKIVNTAGPHPLYAGTGESDSDQDSPQATRSWKWHALELVPMLVVFAVVNLGMYLWFPTTRFSINGETTRIAFEGATMWGAIAMQLVVILGAHGAPHLLRIFLANGAQAE